MSLRCSELILIPSPTHFTLSATLEETVTYLSLGSTGHVFVYTHVHCLRYLCRCWKEMSQVQNSGLRLGSTSYAAVSAYGDEEQRSFLEALV
jgi:hypothetical protein